MENKYSSRLFIQLQIESCWWAGPDSNRRPSARQADVLTKLDDRPAGIIYSVFGYIATSSPAVQENRQQALRILHEQIVNLQGTNSSQNFQILHGSDWLTFFLVNSEMRNISCPEV